MFDFVRRLLRAIKTFGTFLCKKRLLFLILLVVVSKKSATIGISIANASVPIWFTNAVNARAADGLTWPEVGAIAVLTVTAAITALLGFFWSDWASALYNGWLAHELRELWKLRPWNRDDEPPTEGYPDDGGEIKNNGSDHSKP